MAPISDQELARRAEALEWIVCDVDGVLTCGGLFYDPSGTVTLRFDVRDGMGLKLAQSAGLRVALMSGRSATAAEKRAEELRLDAVFMGVGNKGNRLASFLAEQGITREGVAFIGDDINDLAVLRACGLSFAPADAVEEVRAVVDRVLETPGGQGAVREMIEILLRARGEWDDIVERYGRG